MERPTHAGLRHLALNVRDLEAMTRFYVDLLGFAVEWEPDADNVYLSSGIDNLALHRIASPSPGVNETTETRHAGAAVPRAGAGALDHLGLIVRHADDVDRWAGFWRAAG